MEEETKIIKAQLHSATIIWLVYFLEYVEHCHFNQAIANIARIVMEAKNCIMNFELM